MLYHCARPEDRPGIQIYGLRGKRHEPYLFAWPTLNAAEEYRRDVCGSWADIWAFEDHGSSTASVAMSAGETARTVVGHVPPHELKLEYAEPTGGLPRQSAS
jgi:hypothetical protein